MPLYEFECSTCGTHFERLQKLADADPEICPECGKQSIKRCLTAPAFRLAGSGWYETDFKKEGEKKHNLAGNHDTPNAQTSHNAGGDSAPAATAAKVAEPASPAKPAAKSPSGD